MADAHDSWLKKALGVDVGKALQKIDAAGKAVLNAESAAWEGTKKAYGAATAAYDKVAPNFDESNKALGQGVDKVESLAKEGNKKAAAKYAKVPVVGKVLKASAAVANTAVDATGGVVKGAGDLTAMAGNAIVHPIDAAGAMAEGALGIVEHVPMAPGVNTTAKAAHGLVDLARGKKDGEYGGNLKELGENLAMGTHRNAKDPNKRSNADLDFAAGLGGGTEAWSEKPAEAATRTLVNLAPMFVGDEAAPGKPGPKGGPPAPKGPNAPRGVNPFAKTEPAAGRTQDLGGKTGVDLGETQDFGKTQDLSKTKDLGKTQPDLGGTLDGAPPEGEPVPGGQVVIDAQQASLRAARQAARQALMEATQEYVRYQQKMLDGDPSWDPAHAKKLDAKARAAEQAWIQARRNLEAAQKSPIDPDAKTQRAPDPTQQNLVDASAAAKAAEKANFEATQKYVRYRQKLLDKDPSWNAGVDQQLLDEANAAEQASIQADRKLEAAQAAAKKAQGLDNRSRKK